MARRLDMMSHARMAQIAAIVLTVVALILFLVGATTAGVIVLVPTGLAWGAYGVLEEREGHHDDGPGDAGSAD